MPRQPSPLLLLVLLCLFGCGGDESGTTEAPLDKDEPWDLVWISDSMGWDVAESWADQIEAAEGVEVRVHDYATSHLSLVQARAMLTDQAKLRSEVADAEIIVVYGNPDGASPADSATCHTPSPAPRDPPDMYTIEDFAAYGDALRDVYDIVFELRAGQPTVIRAFDVFNGVLADLETAGIEPECTATWESEAGALREAADDYGVILASFYDEFNGVGHDEDPRAKGYISADGYHASSEGVTVQVETLHRIGYGTIIP